MSKEGCGKHLKLVIHPLRRTVSVLRLVRLFGIHRQTDTILFFIYKDFCDLILKIIILDFPEIMIKSFNNFDIQVYYTIDFFFNSDSLKAVV